MEPNILFHIGGFPISEPIFFTWIIMAILSIGSFLLTRNLQKIPKGAQHFAEVAVEGIENMVKGDIGPEGKVFVPLILTIASYVGLANMIGVIPKAYSPTEDLSTTIALALIVFIVGHVAAITKKGFRPWIKGFFEPYFFIFPINIAGEISQVISHSFRLYGNIFAGGILLSIIYWMAPYIVPVPLLAWFGIFMGLIQAAVFTLLSVAYIQASLN